MSSFLRVHRAAPRTTPLGVPTNSTFSTLGPAATRTLTLEVAATPPPPVAVRRNACVTSSPVAGTMKAGRSEFAVVPSV